MNADVFLAQARKAISKDPSDRVFGHVNDLKDTSIYDVHCHIFDCRCLPLGYFILRFLTYKAINKLDKERENFFMMEGYAMESISAYSKPDSFVGIQEERLYQLIENNEEISLEKIENDIHIALQEEQDDLNRLNEAWSKELKGEIFLDDLPGNLELSEVAYHKEFKKDIGLFSIKKKRMSDLKFALKVLKYKSNGEIFKDYLDNFSVKNLNTFRDKTFITCAIMMDTQAGWDFKKQRKSITSQVEELLNLTHQYSTTDTPVLPFFSVDPRRTERKDENLFDLFLKAFPENGPSFFGVKFYPCLGYLPSDHRLLPIYEICQEKNIPILTHCGASLISTFEKGTTKLTLTENFDPNDRVEISFIDRRDFGDFLNQPEHWRPVLEKFPKLKLNIGHFGSEKAWIAGAGKTITAIQTNKPAYASFDKADRRETIMKLMKDFDSVYSDFSFNIANDETYGPLLEEFASNKAIIERTMFGTDFWVIFSETFLFGPSLMERQEAFVNTFSAYKNELFTSVPAGYLFGFSENTDGTVV